MNHRILAAISLLFLPAGVVLPCHLPQHLRQLEHLGLTADQLSILAHDGADFTQIPYDIEAAVPCTNGQADIFDCHRIDLLEVVQLSDIGGGSGNDIWGWVDPVTGREWALVGRSNGTAFVDVSDPENPVYVGNLPTEGSSSTWRDIKTYADHAFIVADFAGNHGMQVFDLSRLRGVVSPPATFSADTVYTGFDRAHNVAINIETGFAYAVGSDTCSGGLHMIDISDPLNPTNAGCFSGDGYTHDAQCVSYLGPDPDHQGAEICVNSNEDTVTIVDVTDKGNPTQLSRTGYSGAAYTHQGWLTEDHAYFIHDDEIDELTFGHTTKTYVWDVTDLDAPTLAGTYFADGMAIDHNQYILDGHTYQANYRRGIRVLSLDDLSQGVLSEAAYFDTYPEGDGLSFEGAWSVYPYFESGIVIVSDINRGLFILDPQLDPLVLSGSCPGTMQLSLSGQTPGGRVALLRGDAEGTAEVPVGSCAGTPTGLDAPRLLTVITMDGNGAFEGAPDVPIAACGTYFQALDLTTCVVTNILQVN